MKWPHGVRSEMATVLIMRSQAVKRTEQSVPLGDRADVGHWFQMKGIWEGGGVEKGEEPSCFLI